MRGKIQCVTTDKGIHSFYMILDDAKYYLFSQAFKRGVHELYRNGIDYNDAINHAKSHHDRAINKTMEKIPIYVEYVEKEYGIRFLEKTKKKASQHCRNSA